jgi:soluble lytic murein transglycosylase-like protein
MFDDLIQQSSDQYQVPASWIQAIIDVESAWDPNAYREEPSIHDASYGLMQLLGSTARGLGFQDDLNGLYDPRTNIDLGTQLLAQLRHRWGDDFRSIYSAYNSGKPDLWQTSQQVAANVERAVASLQKYLTQAVQPIVQNPGASALVAILVMMLLFAWTRKQ